jgi:hypothetical protein
MQLSSWLKSRGDTASLNEPDPDEVWISCIFDKNRQQAYGLKTMYNVPVHFGGSGIDLSRWLPEDAQKIKPDYDLYPSKYSLGFTTRGCIRKCPFCIVPQKEGKHHRWQHISEFHDDKFDTATLLDNNWYVDRKWFMDNTQYLIDNDLKESASAFSPLQGGVSEPMDNLPQKSIYTSQDNNIVDGYKKNKA